MPFIYKLVGGGDEVYIGSTIQSLNNRLSHHKTDYKRLRGCSSEILFEKYGINNVMIELIEEVSEDEMLHREKFHILNTANVVNKYMPIINEEERKEKIKKYNEANKEYIAERAKIYNQANKEYIAERWKNYYADNKEYFQEKGHKRNSINCDCECGGKYKLNNKARHLTSIKHTIFTNSA